MTKFEKIIFFVNFLIFEFNSFFLLKKKDIITVLKFKNVDKIPILFSRETFNNISNYLNTNYFSSLRKKDFFYSNKTNEKIITIDCLDFLNNSKYCIDHLNTIFKGKKNYKFIIDTNNPDYVLYDAFGCQHIDSKYNNSIKIAYFSENIIPDFNDADYALSQAHIIYFDRYFKYPSFIWRLNNFRNYNIVKIREEVLRHPIRKKFCAAVISNNQSFSLFRLGFIRELNKYKKVDMGGYVFNNIGSQIKNKIEFLSSYKFSISMENSDGDGYVSEKILESFISGTIPIYYGNYMVDEYINPKAYILIKGVKDLKKKIEYIIKIDNDNELYKNLLNESIFVFNNIVEKIEKEKEQFFFNIFESNKNFSKRKDMDITNLKCFR